MSIELARGRGRVIIAAAIVSAAAILVSIATTSPRRADSSDSAHGAAAPAHSAGQAQYFEANRGQADPSVSFLCHSRAYTMFLTRSEAVYRIVRRLGRTADVPGVGIRLRDNSTLQMALVRIALMGASPDVRVEGAQPLAGRVNYLIGDDPAKWHTGVPTYSQVRYRAAYPGIDLVYYGSYPALEYDLVVAPGADPSVIRFAITATGTARIDLQGNVEIATPAGTLTMRRPRIYQESTLGGQDPVDGHFVLRKAGVAYQVGIELGRYDARRPLVIDPQLVYSSFLGGSGEKATGASGDVAKDIVLDSSNHAYIAGGTFSSDFPTTTGPHTDPGEKNGTPVAFVAKFDTTRRGAASLVYSTYLGGSGNTANGVQDGDSATGIAVDGQGHAYVTGFTTSTDFPHTPGAWETTNNQGTPTAFNGFVTELAADGSLPIYSTFINGSKGVEAASIALKPNCMTACEAYLTGITFSTSAQGFRVTANAFQSDNRDSQYSAFLLVLNGAGSSAVYSSFIGGTGTSSGGDIGNHVTVDAAGNAYIAGFSYSTNYPTLNPYQKTNRASIHSSFNIVVTEINPAASTAKASLKYSTYLGGTGILNHLGDAARSVVVDNSGHIWVAGLSYSGDYPTTANCFQSKNKANMGLGTGAFNAIVTELDPSKTTTSQLLYSTYIGGSGTYNLFVGEYGDVATSMVLDSSGDVFIAGGTASSDYPVSAHACQRQLAGVLNAFVTKLKPSAGPPAAQLLFSTYLGGSFIDSSTGIAIDPSLKVYTAGGTASSDFPIVPGPYQNVNKAANLSESNAFVSVLDPGSNVCPRTPTPTPTRIITRTPTRTPSRTMSRTPRSSPTRTPGRTATRTPARTSTRTSTRTVTRTPTPTHTLSRTPTRTPTRSTRTVTRTPSRTPTRTPTRTRTRTPTPTRTRTPTPKPT